MEMEAAAFNHRMCARGIMGVIVISVGGHVMANPNHIVSQDQSRTAIHTNDVLTVMIAHRVGNAWVYATHGTHRMLRFFFLHIFYIDYFDTFLQYNTPLNAHIRMRCKYSQKKILIPIFNHLPFIRSRKSIEIFVIQFQFFYSKIFFPT